MTDRIFLSPPNLCGEEFKYLYEAFHSNWIAPLGANVDGFEKELAALTATEAAAALSSGTAAVFLGLKALGVKPGDRVFCADLTFAGSCFPICHLGAHPVFIDSEPLHGNLSPEALERALFDAKRQNALPTAAVIVDLYGNPADYARLLPLCREYGVPVLEDAAEALGSVCHGAPCGSLGDIGVFSFNGNKIVTTSGGGAAVSRDAEKIAKIRFWASQAKEAAPYYEHREVGYNYRLSNICAGIGRGQLTALSEKLKGRRRVREYYRQALRGCPLRLLPEPADSRSNCWLTVILLEHGAPLKPSEFIQKLEEQNIESRRVWKPMHLQPVFGGCPYISARERRSVSAELFERGVCLPSGEGLTETQLGHVADAVKNCF